MSAAANIFRFKRFHVANERSAMKVNTDGVLLGASMTIRPEDHRLLDIGTGTGTIALMAAQRLYDISETEDTGFRIMAIDIDEPSASEAAVNFSNSPWRENLHAYNLSLDEFAAQSTDRYDLIFSNPPYFEDSLTAPDQRKSTARHTSGGLSYRDIFEFAASRLSDGGRVCLILPADQREDVCRYARMCGLHLFRILNVKTVPRRSPSRIIVEFVNHRVDMVEDIFMTIQNDGKYTSEYLDLMKDFYLFA